MTFPACFNDQNEYDMWMIFRRLAGDPVSICADCTPEYKSEMKQCDRCHPPKAEEKPVKPRHCWRCGKNEPDVIFTQHAKGICTTCKKEYMREYRGRFGTAKYSFSRSDCL